MPLKVDVFNAALLKLPPTPLTTVHAPVPVAGLFAAKVTVVKPQVAAPVWSGPALDTVGAPVTVMVTLEVDAIQGALLIVQTNT